MSTHPPRRPVLLVVGNGMVGHHFLEAAVDRGLHESYEIVVLGEERRAPTTASTSPPRSRAPTLGRWCWAVPTSTTTTGSDWCWVTPRSRSTRPAARW